MNNTLKYSLIIFAVIFLLFAIIGQGHYTGTSDLVALAIIAYILPLSPTILLIVSKIIKSKPLMNASLIIGVLPAFAVIIVMMASTKVDSWNVSPIILLAICIPWLVIRTPSYLFCKIKDDSFNRQNSILNFMFAVDAFLLFVACMVIFSLKKS